MLAARAAHGSQPESARLVDAWRAARRERTANSDGGVRACVLTPPPRGTRVEVAIPEIEMSFTAVRRRTRRLVRDA